MDFVGVLSIAMSFVVMALFGIGSMHNIPLFLDFPSFVIVFVCTFLAMVSAYPLSFWKTVPGFYKMYVIVQKHDLPATINVIIALAERGRREGLLALDNSLDTIEDPFLKKGIQFAVDAMDRAIIEDVLSIEMDKIDERHKANALFLDNMAAMGPTFGMMGTVIGLVLMLKNMSDPSAIGPAMAIALITTYYGSILANIICWPIATRLRLHHADEMAEKRVMLDGVLAVQAGENPKVMMYKLISHLDPATRVAFEAAREKDKNNKEE
jgi:chemotaxis protein MotA